MNEVKTQFLEHCHPREFVPNNIRYRIACASALSRFKLAQTSTLSEIVANEVISFSNTAKEILIFKYDVWSQFIYMLEQYMLVTKDLSTTILKNYIKNTAQATERYYIETILNKPEHFNAQYASLWIQIHAAVVEYILEKTFELIDEKSNVNDYYVRGEIFSRICDILTLALHRTLYELYEIDCWKYHCHENLILNLDDCVVTMYENEQINILIRTLEVFKHDNPHRFNETKRLIVKKYLSDDEIPSFLISDIKKYVRDVEKEITFE